MKVALLILTVLAGTLVHGDIVAKHDYTYEETFDSPTEITGVILYDVHPRVNQYEYLEAILVNECGVDRTTGGLVEMDDTFIGGVSPLLAQTATLSVFGHKKNGKVDALHTDYYSYGYQIPEPATASLVLGFGLAILLVRRRFIM